MIGPLCFPPSNSDGAASTCSQSDNLTYACLGLHLNTSGQKNITMNFQGQTFQLSTLFFTRAICRER